MRKKRGILTVLLAVLLLLAGCAGDAPVDSVTINGTEYALDTTQLDLRGVTGVEVEQIVLLNGLESLDLRDTGISTEEYDTLRAALPACDILWSVPFQDGYLDCDTREIAVTSLTAEDVERLDYLEGLSRVDGNACRDYDQLLALQQRRGCEVDYTLEIGGQAYALDTRELTLEGLTSQELEQWLPHLPNLESITLTGIQENVEELLDMMETQPQIVFDWNMELLGVEVNSLAAEIDFSNISVEDLPGLESIVTRLPNVEKVVMCECGISNEEMDALNRRYEDIQFVWTITIRNVKLRTDITYLMPYQYDLWPSTEEAQLFRYLTELECLDLGHHNIANCDFVAYMPHMKYLLLGDTGITDLSPLEGLEELVYLEIFMTYVTDYTPLLSLPSLESLNLCYSYGQVDVVAQLTWVDYIRWITTDTHKLRWSEMEYLQESLPDTYLELGTHQSSTGGQWRLHQHYYDMRDMLGMHYMTG